CLLGLGSEVSFGAEERSEQGEESEGSAEASLPSPDVPDMPDMEMERAIQREIQRSFGTSMAPTE
ncbi:unnamed protein product, partial [Symbiodinium necroappetens]